MHAADVLLAARAQLYGKLSPDHPSVPPWYARQILAADDRYGVAADLVVQGQDVSWAAIDGLVDLAIYGMLAHRRFVHAGGTTLDCARCGLAASWQPVLLEPVAARRHSSAERVLDELRAELAADLS